VGNSGTAIRLLAGMLSATGFTSVLTGDISINSRPMARIIDPLREMGANISGRANNTKAPLIIFGNKKLKGRNFDINISSAQVKSCIILAAIFAEGITEIVQPEISRDHTERMLEYFGVNIKYDGRHTKVIPGNPLEGKDIFVPGDISSAAYFIVASLILKDSSIMIRNVGINPTRSYFIEILKSMGARIKIGNKRILNNEPVGDIEASSSRLHSIEIDNKSISNIIDEIPILAVAAAFAEGKTVISGAEELRFKESDRIRSISSQFIKLGVEVEEKKDGMIISGYENLKINDSTVDAMNDHRIAMSLAILGLRSSGAVKIINSQYIDTSFPGFKYEIRKSTS
jgi:3-phosphoshikimate 1-carboxyvinyltransferase